jgi:hypothetical protein
MSPTPEEVRRADLERDNLLRQNSALFPGRVPPIRLHPMTCGCCGETLVCPKPGSKLREVMVEISEMSHFHEAADPRTGCHGRCPVCSALGVLGIPSPLEQATQENMMVLRALKEAVRKDLPKDPTLLKVLAWLGFFRDRLPDDALKALERLVDSIVEANEAKGDR